MPRTSDARGSGVCSVVYSVVYSVVQSNRTTLHGAVPQVDAGSGGPVSPRITTQSADST